MRRSDLSLERGPNQLASRPHTGFFEQLLQSRFDGGFRYTNLAADFLVGQPVEQPFQNNLLPLGEAVQAQFLMLRVTVGDELNHLLIHPGFAAGYEANRVQEAA